MVSFPSLTRILIAGLLLTAVARGQMPPEATAGNPDVEVTAHAAKETEAQTIARCLPDLQSPDPKVRHRTILVLGKYQNPTAQAQLIKALADADDSVRQAALVSLLEGDFLIPAAREPVARLLVDPQVQIRRIASSACRDLMMPAFMITTGVVIINGQPETVETGKPPQESTPDMLSFINRALLDEDLIVRKNVLTYGQFARGRLDQAALMKNLTFPDKEIRVLALRNLAQGLSLMPTDLLPLALSLANDPEAVVREEVARTLPRCGTTARDPLRKLTTDANSAVRMAALEGLCQLQDPLVLELIVPLMKEENMPVADKKRLLWSLPSYGEPGIRKLVELTQNTPLAVQAEAVRMAAAFAGAGLKAEFFLGFLDSSSRELRSAAAGALLRFQQELTPEQIRKFCGSRYPEVRTSGLQLCLRLPREEAATLVGDFLLDDDLDIRTLAIMYAAHLKIPDWQMLMKQTLNDTETRIRAAAAQALLANPDTECRQILEDYLKNHPDSELAEIIRERLRPPTERRPDVPASGIPKIQSRPNNLPNPVSPLKPLRNTGSSPDRAPAPKPAPSPVAPAP